MPELRQDPTTGLWTVISGDRGHRPIRLVTPELAALPPSDCPFCVGNEAATMPTLAETRDKAGWRARAFPNRFPALRVEATDAVVQDGPWLRADGLGAHEIIVDTPEHDARLWERPEAMLDGLRLARDRMADLHRDVRLRHLGWFRNSGALAGASQPHPHAQIVGAHVTPWLVAQMVERAQAWQREHGRRLMDDLVAFERAGPRLVRAGPVVAFCPAAPRFTFETWLVPDGGGALFHEASDAVITALADTMCAVLRAIHAALAPPAWNAVLYQAPRDAQQGFVWHVRICPRRVAPGGWELLSGGTILHIAPEEAAAALRGDGPLGAAAPPSQ